MGILLLTRRDAPLDCVFSKGPLFRLCVHFHACTLTLKLQNRCSIPSSVPDGVDVCVYVCVFMLGCLSGGEGEDKKKIDMHAKIQWLSHGYIEGRYARSLILPRPNASQAWKGEVQVSMGTNASWSHSLSNGNSAANTGDGGRTKCIRGYIARGTSVWKLEGLSFLREKSGEEHKGSIDVAHARRANTLNKIKEHILFNWRVLAFFLLFIFLFVLARTDHSTIGIRYFLCSLSVFWLCDRTIRLYLGVGRETTHTIGAKPHEATPCVIFSPFLNQNGCAGGYDTMKKRSFGTQ